MEESSRQGKQPLQSPEEHAEPAEDPRWLCLLRLSPSPGDVVPWAQVSRDLVTVSPLEACLLPHSEQRGQTPDHDWRSPVISVVSRLHVQQL